MKPGTNIVPSQTYTLHDLRVKAKHKCFILGPNFMDYLMLLNQQNNWLNDLQFTPFVAHKKNFPVLKVIGRALCHFLSQK